MAIHVLERTQRLPITPEEAWDFFSDPGNLALITPPSLRFEITSRPPGEIYPGAVITYRIRPLFGIPASWVTEISHVEKPSFFVDIQLLGPYRLWHHQHNFAQVEGGTEMRDTVHYALPFGPLGEMAHRILVRRRLEEIFDFRRQFLAGKFGSLREG